MNAAVYTLLGVALGLVPTFIMHYNDRKDRYLFAILDKRFEVAQHAYILSERLKSVIHGDEEIRMDKVSEARKWFDENNLYLSPEIRDDLRKVIWAVDFYHLELSHYYSVKREEGNTENTKLLHQELLENFSSIQGLRRRIQENMNIYYKFTKRS